MKYCLSIGLHNLFFDIAVVDQEHNIISKHKCSYDRSKDISSNIHLAYKKYFSGYSISFVGVGISNNITFKDEFLYKVNAFDFNRYNLKQSLYKLFKVEIYIVEETYLASLAVSYDVKGSLLYLVLDKKISNSFVIENNVIELEDDINLRSDNNLNMLCSKDAIKAKFLQNNFDDDYIGMHFLSKNVKCREIIKEWANNLNKYLIKITKELPVSNIVFAGYLGEYLNCYKEYLSIDKSVSCIASSSHRQATLLGVSHLIFKDN